MAIEEAVLDVTCNLENQDQLVGKKNLLKVMIAMHWNRLPGEIFESL